MHAGSPPEVKVGFFGALFAARTDLYAVRWENARTGQKGWLPAVRGGWRKGVPHPERDYLPLTAGVLSAHLSGQMHLGLYPLQVGPTRHTITHSASSGQGGTTSNDPQQPDLGIDLGELSQPPVPVTPSSLPRQSHSKDASSNTPAGFCAPIPVRAQPKSMTITM